MREIFRKVSVQKTSRRLVSYFLMSCVKRFRNSITFVYVYQSIITNRNPMCSRKAVPKDFATFIREQQNARACFWLKIDCRKGGFREICKISENNVFPEHLWATDSLI